MSFAIIGLGAHALYLGVGLIACSPAVALACTVLVQAAVGGAR